MALAVFVSRVRRVYPPFHDRKAINGQSQFKASCPFQILEDMSEFSPVVLIQSTDPSGEERHRGLDVPLRS